ncbi:hypothetical protein [Roseobacter sp. HKCCA0434]|uniref:hypothetical protein n=1 Tax=Roseobacter sp. HKCCA0434 TaxID=3079297 RepID=UPI00290592C0|nr:hypothetical protein [Roseobacter sp. HKCCA0434]
MILRSAGALILAASLAGCAAPNLSSAEDAGLTREERLTYGFSGARVHTENAAHSLIGRDVTAEELSAALERAADEYMVWTGGDRPAIVSIDIEAVNIISAGQTMLVGGVSALQGTVSMTDAETGVQIGDAVTIITRGDGYAPGGLLGVVTMRETPLEVDALAEQFVRQARRVLLGG